MERNCMTVSTQFHDNAHLNRYTRVGVYPDGLEDHRAVYEGACFICGNPVTITKVWHCAAEHIPDLIRDRFLCDEHG